MSIYQDLLNRKTKICVVGLGYVGLPIALEFGKYFDVIGFDIKEDRVALMKAGEDPSKELDRSAFEKKSIQFTSNPDEIINASFYVVAVPTDIDESRVPNLKPILGASKSVGNILKKGDYVVFESTVYPGCTEEDCLPILERLSGLKLGKDFKLGYSPERIVPGDKTRTLTKITKIVSGSDAEALEEIAKIYDHILEEGIHKASSIKVAEAAKVIENTQRDLNISLMNELSMIFDRLNIDTKEVLEAAGTKWNFLKFYPGLVGGHCISVDPYYLLHKSKQLGIDPQVIAAGRRINDGMPSFIAKKAAQMLIENGKNPGNCKALIMGVTFKEDVADIRNSKVIDLYKELTSYSIHVHITDEHASPNEVAHEYGVSMVDSISSDYDLVIVAVGHDKYKHMNISNYKSITNENPIIIDLKGIYDKETWEKAMTYWRL
ncbi:UDP-N-acetyl-D-galactosamine dehydrogenase [Portibacter lacus]|uniref:UDP-N-acetyl-D-galactosamine dehydrogenase n=1 Tax=Portibacter lacus TaxID=1099794 RepID=A0AA37WH33_9BACT|nr:nucleotide sugar dehydrogenase [Portibacter lacus]GLR18824.1 UDP-N-acetyl-D-galactosamine dehydrogenase [Portibacter lacus]